MSSFDNDSRTNSINGRAKNSEERKTQLPNHTHRFLAAILASFNAMISALAASYLMFRCRVDKR